MTVFATGVSYVLIEYLKFIDAGDRGNFTREQYRRVGAELSGRGQSDPGRPGPTSFGSRRF